MPNIFAYFVFFSWPFVVFWLLKRRPTYLAVFIAIALSGILLPFQFTIDLPLVPPLNKETITTLSLLIFLFLLKKKFQVFMPGLVTIIILFYFLVAIISVELNTDAVMINGKFLAGLTDYDAVSNVIKMLLSLMPFLLGRYFLNNIKDTETIFKALIVMGLIYTLPMLIELRMSPQMHNWVYGYGPASFMQQVRDGGYRPIVFIGHGLGLAFWFSGCVIAALALQKNKVRIPFLSGVKLIGYLFFILILCKTWSALAYVALAAILIFKVSPSKQVMWSFILAALILIYPIAKTSGLIPSKEIVSSIKEYSEERAQSLDFRFKNEDPLLAHALERPYFGWNGWGRNRLYDDYGKDISVTDGTWILELGMHGVMGFILYYLILLMPLYYAVKNINSIKDAKDKVYFATLAIILAIGVIDSVPNSGMAAMHFFLAGALLGQAELIKKQKYLLDNEKTKQNN